ncbi:MAG TPA: hypothetical protein VEG60_24455 [Candidatus Binatia bacterium]|nr:hypothetical protein [Candidatus Binatia bacterium]
MEIVGTPRSGKRYADVWPVNRYAVRDSSAIIPDQIQGLTGTGAQSDFPSTADMVNSGVIDLREKVVAGDRDRTGDVRLENLPFKEYDAVFP